MILVGYIPQILINLTFNDFDVSINFEPCRTRQNVAPMRLVVVTIAEGTYETETTTERVGATI